MTRLSCPSGSAKRPIQRRDRGEVYRSGGKRKPTDQHREPTLGRAIHDGLLKVGFDVIRSHVTKRTWLTETDSAFGGAARFRTTTRRRSPPRSCSLLRRSVLRSIR